DQISVIHAASDPLAVAGLILMVAMIGVGAGLWVRRRPAGVAILFMVVTTALTCNVLFFIGTLLAERLLYLPVAGAALLAGGAATGARRPVIRLVAGGLAAAAVIACAGRTWARLPDWRDDLALYTSAARVSPRSARIRYNLGNVHLRQADYAEAETNYPPAPPIYPDFLHAPANLAMSLVQHG